MAEPRQIRCYVSPVGRNKIADWYGGLPVREQALTDEFIKNQRKIQSWEMPDYRRLGDGIGELRWFAGKKQHRLLGFSQKRVWYALIGCMHKQQVYKPTDCLDTAKKRKAMILNGEASSEEYDL